MKILKPTENSGRGEYAATWVFASVLALLSFSFFNEIVSHIEQVPPMLWLLWLFGLFCSWLAIAAIFRRVRDIGWSWGHGFWQFVPLAGFIFAIVIMFIPPGGESKQPKISRG